MTIIEKAKILRKQIETLALDMDDNQSLEFPELFPNWKTETDYKIGDRVRYDDVLFKCLQAHKSQSDWIPDVAVSLWTKVADPSIEWPEWVQPTGAHDAYAKGDKVSFDSRHWISQVDNNVWSPLVYGWEEVVEVDQEVK